MVIMTMDMAMGRSRRHRRKRRRLVLKIALVLVVLAVTAAALVWMYQENQKDTRTGTEAAESERAYRKVTVDGVDYTYNTDLITMLILGIDSSEEDMMGQSDFIALLIFDRAEKRMRIIEISRDSMVPVMMYDAIGNELGWNTQHLALAYPFAGGGEKGCLMAQEAVSRMFQNIPIVYYGAVNISAIPLFHNLVGEITIQIPENEDLGYPGDDLDEGGTLTLTSENVERFVRSRDTEEDFSNTGRMRRQQLYMEAYLEKLKTLLKEDFSGVVSRMEDVFSYTVTNISLTEVSSFAEMALNYQFDPDQDFYTVQGTDQSGTSHDEFIVDEEALQQLVLQIFYNEKK